MIIEIFAVLSAFIFGYLVGRMNAISQKPQQKSNKHQFLINRQISLSSKDVSNKINKMKQNIYQVQWKEDEKVSNKKKKNKKKKKQHSPQKELDSIREQEQIESVKKNEYQKQTKMQQKSLWNSSKLNQKSKKTEDNSKQQMSKSCQFFQVSLQKKTSKQSQEQLITDFIMDQIQLIRNYFLEQLQQIIPYHKNFGKYKLLLIGTTKQITLEWTYHNSKYPLQIIQITFIYDHLKPIQIDMLNEMVNEQKAKLMMDKNKRMGFYNYIFNLSTTIYQDLLITINEQPQQSFYADRTLKDITHQLNKTHGHDTSRLFTVEKKEIYGKLLQQIFYMQDFKSQPNDSLLINNPVQNIQKKYHTRGRYANQFQELQMIGQGGFGKVYKAKNRLDSNTYAIKKIIINYSNSTDRKLLKQVTLLSKLNHPNIVRYHQSWLEDASNINELIEDMSIAQSDEKEELKHIYEDWRRSRGGVLFQDNSGNISQESFEEGSDDGIMFQEDDGIHFEDCSDIQFQPQSKQHSISQNPNRKVSFSKIQQSNESKQDQKSDFPFKILYIVMQFCQGINLKQFISKRFHEEQIKIQIIRGILEGLSYIHERKIIHRDLKPANIFLTQHNKVKIGDFGLATTGTFQEKAIHEIYQKNNRQIDFQKTIGIGTAFYRAPQQLKSPKYDEKVDIYSLGIIIFEMFYEFSTYSQRFKILSDITKTSTLPKDFNLYGQITDYQISIQNCIKQKSELRPTARKLLQNFRNKYFVLLVSAIANPKYTQFYQLIKHLFQISNERRIQSVRRNYFKNYDFQCIFNIFKIHRGNIFPTFPLVFANDYKTINGFKIQSHQSRKQKFLVMSQQGVLLQYATNLYAPWIIYAKQTMRKRKIQFLSNEFVKVQQMRRFAFQKIIQVEYDSKKQETNFKQKYVTGFDICYDLDVGFSAFFTLEMLIMSSSIIQTLHLTQQNLPIYICHSKIFVILSKHYKIPPYKFYSCLLSTSEQKFSALTELKKLQYFERYQIQGLVAKKLSILFQQSFEQFDEWIKIIQIWNIQEYSEYWEIRDQLNKLLKLNQCFQLQEIEYKLMIPNNNCNGIFWNTGPIKGFTAIQDYNTGTVTGYLCNINLQMTLSQGQDICDVSMWSNQQFLQSEIMELVQKCWRMGVSAKFYQQGKGEKDESSKMNMIIKKKKGERIHYYIRKNENKKYGNNKIRLEQGNKQLSSVVVKEQFNHEVFKQIHPQLGSSGNLLLWNKRKND